MNATIPVCSHCVLCLIPCFILTLTLFLILCCGEDLYERKMKQLEFSRFTEQWRKEHDTKEK
jgi:hypothetical protein